MGRSYWFKTGTSEGLEAAQVETLLGDLLQAQATALLPEGCSLSGISISLEERDDPYTDRSASVTWRGTCKLQFAGRVEPDEQWDQNFCGEAKSSGGGDIWWVRIAPLG